MTNFALSIKMCMFYAIHGWGNRAMQGAIAGITSSVII